MIIYLYIKQHSITGLKYFGKTTKNPFLYNGSGKYWSRHIKKYGPLFIQTIEVWGFDNQTSCTEFALKFSKDNNIVESNEWANLCLENGTDGGPRSNSYFKIYNTMPRSENSKQKMSASRQGNKNSCKQVIIDGVNFSSMLEAATQHSVTYNTIYNWTKKGKAILN